MSKAWIFLVISTFCNAIGSVLVKVASMGNYNTKLGIYISWPFMIAVFLFGTNLLFYAQAIKEIPLYIAYPIVVGITIIIITFFSSYFYQSKIQIHEISAVVLILIGITILSR